jgi:predicted dehydrogenase/threonine dehydrogenase-like Zn-dependent dehydrogenase
VQLTRAIASALVKQVILRSGAPELVDVPAPSPEAGRVLVANLASVISSGTERAAVEQAGGGPLPIRALRNPDLIKAGIRHLREHGLRQTAEAVRELTEGELPLGYSCSGVVLDTGGIAEFRVGQLVACAGAGSANHAEVVSVPGNLVVAAPQNVNPRAAAFTTIGAIALQGVRRAAPSLGERFVVVGLGLLGLLTVQLLRTAGCEVLGIEPNENRRRLGSSLGADRVAEPREAADVTRHWTEEAGADGVVVCAASRDAAGLLNQSVELVRAKGRVVVVGDVRLELERAPLYVREADVLISTSYGPGRHDPTYEEAGVDYPLGYVRWTENRNMGEILRLLSTGRLQVEPLIGLELPLVRAPEAYAALADPEPPLAAVLSYESRSSGLRPEVVRTSQMAGRVVEGNTVRVALIGPGSFAKAVHVPNLKADPGVRVVVVAGRRGVAINEVAQLVGGADATTEWRSAIERDDVDLVLIGTRHDSHAEIAAAGLRAGKAVFVEKPLGLTREEIDSVWEAGRDNDRLAIGFNRPFAPAARALERELRGRSISPVHLVYRVSAPLDPHHWLNDPAIGGGRILGEACHMFDFANWLCGTPERVMGASLPSTNGVRTVESSTVTIDYANGSVATVHYSAVGATSMPKERVEVMCGGHSWVIDDFKSLASYSSKGEERESVGSVDKGHAALMQRVLDACRGDAAFEPGLQSAYAAQSVALAALESIATGTPGTVLLRTR